MATTCAACGSPLDTSARFCPGCGERVRVEAAPVDPTRHLLERALGTHYRIERELGRGGMGIVYFAHEGGLDRDVAIKVLPPDKAESELHRERFRREARTAARLSHPNVVPLHAFGEHQGMLYYVMGYVDGESLAERMQREGPISEPETRRILTAIADALHHAHQQGIVHRDVKPQNVLLEAGSGRPMLTDFGISKLAAEGSALTAAGLVIGTPDYLSPEQASGSTEVGPLADLYSLGVVGYAMLSGRLPFASRTAGEAIVKRLTTAPPPLAAVAPATSPAMVEAVMRCLAKDPAQRWPDAAAFARAIAAPADEEQGQFESVGLLTLALVYYALVSRLLWAVAEQAGPVIEIASQALPALAALGLLVMAGSFVHLRRQGHSLSAWAHEMFREPPVWILWYPRPLRRAGNVWDQLPRDVRWLRAGFSAFVAGTLLVLVPLLVVVAVTPSGPGRWLGPWPRSVRVASGLGTTAVFLAWLVAAWRVPERLRRRGLSHWEAESVAVGSPLARAAFWSRPAVAALLGAAKQSPSTTAAAGPSTHEATRTMGGGGPC